MKNPTALTCIHCGRDESQVPVLVFRYQEHEYGICSEHLPILLHQPGKLSGKLPAAESLPSVNHD